MRTDGTAESGKDPSLNDGQKSQEVAVSVSSSGTPLILLNLLLCSFLQRYLIVRHGLAPNSKLFAGDH